ncbi:hypothetical protein U0070_009259, partial [Myodes glareolus]
MTTASIIYYSQEKYFHHVQQAASVGLERYSNDPVLQFFKAYGVLGEDHIHDAISELESIQSHPDVSLCSVIALLYAHKCCDTIDGEAVQELESSLKEIRKTASDTALYYASLFLWLIGHHDKAREYVDHMLKVCSGSKEGYVLKGWVDLTSNKPHVVKKSIKYLEQGTHDTKDVLGLMGKATYYLTQQNFSGALEVVNQVTMASGNFLPALVLKMRLILEKDESNIDAWQILTVHELVREGNTATCGRHQAVQRLVSGFLERMFMTTPSCALVATELGYLFILQQQVKEACLWYKEAMKLEENRLAALAGSIWCQILQGQLEEAAHQLEFLREVQQSLGKSEVLVFLQALVASKKQKPEQEATALLKEAVELHFSSMQGLALSPEYFEKLDPLFLVCIAKEYLHFCPKQPRSPGQLVSPLLKQVAMILSPVVKVAPAMMDPLFVTAQVKFLSGELENAQSTLQRCLELDPTFVDAHLLMSQIYLAQGNFAMCSHCLELGVSHNFQVRDYPLYHFIKARALNKTGDYAEAIKTLKMIVKLPTTKVEESRKLRGPSVRPSERASILLELVEALRLNGELHEATKIMQDAINEFSGTAEEMRITVANVDLALSKGNVDSALSMLRGITPKQPCYTEAKEKMASIYLHNRKDVRLYIGCYMELCEHLPGPHSSLLLGDAFMNIQEPEKALEVYDEAYRKNPHDASLVSRIGQAYMKTHQYAKAINYYEAAQKISGQDFLCCELAELLLKLKKYHKAEKVLKQALERDSGGTKDISSLMSEVKCLLLLAKVYKNHKKEDVVGTLNQALDLQSRILKRVPLEQPEMLPFQKQLAASICIQTGEHYVTEKDYDNAVALELAQLYLLQGQLDLCEQRCGPLLQMEQTHERAAVMLADLMFRKQNYEAAISLYRQVLEKTPDNFLVLNKLIDLLRRSGKLEEAPAFFELAKKVSSRVPLEPGFNYCQGLYCWHIGQPNEALKFLNKARKDSTWGQIATCYMVQICLNPDNEIVGGETFESLMADSNSTSRKESQQHGVRTAEKLLREFYPHSDSRQTHLRLLQSLCLLATREKANVEAALGAFIEMAQAEKDSIPVLLAMAQAYMLLKQVPKARTQLKRLAKVPWTLDEAEDLERSWLLLADIYCQGGKFDLALELLRRCLHLAARPMSTWVSSWKKSSPTRMRPPTMSWPGSTVTKPALPLVLTEYPNYPKIREEILEKAQGVSLPHLGLPLPTMMSTEPALAVGSDHRTTCGRVGFQTPLSSLYSPTFPKLDLTWLGQ